MASIAIPAAVHAMAGRGPQWATWVASLPVIAENVMRQWGIRPDGQAVCGHCSLVLPVRTADGTPAMMKLGFPEDDSEHEHLALRYWAGRGAVRLLSADPLHRALLLERLTAADLTDVGEREACLVVAELYRHLHIPALPALRSLRRLIDRRTCELAALPRGAPIPRRLVEQAIALGRDLVVDRGIQDRVIHTDLHYGNVLLGCRGEMPGQWLAIDPKPVNGDPHYEIAPMLWNRCEELGGDVRDGVRRRFQMLIDAAGFDEQRAQAWVVVRMIHNAMWALQDGSGADEPWLTRCVTVAKAVQP